MDNEPYHVISHHEARDMILTDQLASGAKAAKEFELPNGKIADVISISSLGFITITEVKTVLKASLVASTFEKYYHYCHRLWLAVPELPQAETIPFEWDACEFPMSHRVGILGVYREGNRVFRKPVDHTLVDNRADQLLRRFTAYALEKRRAPLGLLP